MYYIYIHQLAVWFESLIGVVEDREGDDLAGHYARPFLAAAVLLSSAVWGLLPFLFSHILSPGVGSWQRYPQYRVSHFAVGPEVVGPPFPWLHLDSSRPPNTLLHQLILYTDIIFLETHNRQHQQRGQIYQHSSKQYRLSYNKCSESIVTFEERGNSIISSTTMCLRNEPHTW